MIVVSDTSPIINLARIGQLDLLRQLYGRVIIPDAVYNEIVIAGAGQAGAEEVKDASWLEVRRVVNVELANQLKQKLHNGEADALALSIEAQAELLLLDERQARKIAAGLGLVYTGLLGVILEAKQQGYIISVRQVIDDLMAQASFRVNPAVYAHVLHLAGE